MFFTKCSIRGLQEEPVTVVERPSGLALVKDFRSPAEPSKTEYRHHGRSDQETQLNNKIYKLLAELHMTFGELERIRGCK